MTLALPPWPTYLLPSLPFRRRSSSATTASTCTTVSEPPYLSNRGCVLACAKCRAELVAADGIISKGFTGRHGKAYLVAPSRGAELPNVRVHKAVDRTLVTGLHTVGDISCRICNAVLGWKYIAAEEDSQRYKVGKFILETKKIVRVGGWEGDEDDGVFGEMKEAEGGDGTVVFDSEDEEECEDLFLGIWSESLAKKRRKDRMKRLEAVNILP